MMKTSRRGSGSIENAPRRWRIVNPAGGGALVLDEVGAGADRRSILLENWWVPGITSGKFCENASKRITAVDNAMTAT